MVVKIMAEIRVNSLDRYDCNVCLLALLVFLDKQSSILWVPIADCNNWGTSPIDSATPR